MDTLNFSNRKPFNNEDSIKAEKEKEKTEMNVIKVLTPIIAILAIAGLEALALSLNVNGTMLALSVAAISGIGGFKIKSILEQRAKKNGK